MDKQNFSIELDIKYINDNKKQLCDKWDELYDDENHEQGLHDVGIDECNEIRLDNDGYINVHLGDDKLSFFGNAKLTDEELIEMHDAIETYFDKKVEFQNDINRIANGEHK